MDAPTIYNIKVFLCDAFIIFTVYLITQAINKATATWLDEEGGSHITNENIAVLRSSMFSIYITAWPFHIIIRELLK